MSAYTPIPANRLPELRHTLVGYTRTVTAGLWASMLALREGGTFHIPTKWVHLPIPQIAQNLANDEADRLERARLFSITPQATEEARQAGELLPRFSLHPAHLPSPYGFLVWQDPIDTAATDDGTVEPVVACSWGPYDQDLVWVSFYVDGTAVRDRLSREVRDRIQLHTFGYEREILVPFGQGRWWSERPGMERAAREYEKPVRTLLATWLHMGQKRITETTEVDADRKTKVARTVAKRGRPLPSVRVVDLRPWQPCRSEAGASGRRLDKRVDVTAHWRRRPHTSGLEPDDMVWVRSHGRGPEDAPRAGGHIVTRV
ncbi:hypothetical protein [Nocardiopsis synnemataformans]|uniref:hypothetical protein n=1 Tax=Nocardiopsis synnemataformans TaxID=61305 RepID=UPI003EBCF9A3